MLTCSCLMKGLAPFFRHETFIASLLYLMELFFKIIFNHTSKCEFVVFYFRCIWDYVQVKIIEIKYDLKMHSVKACFIGHLLTFHWIKVNNIKLGLVLHLNTLSKVIAQKKLKYIKDWVFENSKIKKWFPYR